MKQTAEAVIIGGGVMGCSTLYHLARLGMTDTALLERDVLGSGSTGRSQAILRMHYSNPITASMAWESLKVFRDFEEGLGHPSGFVQTGYIVIVESGDREVLEANVAMQQGLGIDTRLVSREDLGELAPMLKVDDAGGLAYEPQSGYADSHLVTTGFAQRARDMGAQVHLRAPALEIKARGGKVEAVVTSQGTIETPRVLVAAGPWAREVLLGLGVDLPLDTVRHQVVTVRRPAELLSGHPAVGDLVQEFSFRPDGWELTLIGIGEDPADRDSYNQGVDPSAVEEGITKLVHRVPAMAEAQFQGGWSGLFTVTPDWHPVLDRMPGVEGLYCAVGFSGHGFKLSPMIGRCMAELIVEGKATTLDISPLRLARFREGDLLTSRYRYNVLA